MAAMREYARVLAPSGLGFIQNPWRPNGLTDEDPAATVEERIKRFGQADHVRIYGADFESRLVAVGLEPRRIMPEDVISEAIVGVMGITPGVPIWIVYGSRSPFRGIPESDFLAEVRNRIQRTEKAHLESRRPRGPILEFFARLATGGPRNRS